MLPTAAFTLLNFIHSSRVLLNFNFFPLKFLDMLRQWWFWCNPIRLNAYIAHSWYEFCSATILGWQKNDWVMNSFYYQDACHHCNFFYIKLNDSEFHWPEWQKKKKNHSQFSLGFTAPPLHSKPPGVLCNLAYCLSSSWVLLRCSLTKPTWSFDSSQFCCLGHGGLWKVWGLWSTEQSLPLRTSLCHFLMGMSTSTGRYKG